MDVISNPERCLRWELDHSFFFHPDLRHGEIAKDAKKKKIKEPTELPKHYVF